MDLTETGGPAPGLEEPTDVLRLALPSKGRLLDPLLDFLDGCGLSVKGARGSREYSAYIPALPGCVVELTSASEIPGRLAKGDVHLAVTGLDLVSEMIGRRPRSLEAAGTSGHESKGHEASGHKLLGTGVSENLQSSPVAIHSLGFGRADLVVAVPRSWIDVETMADLAEVAQLYRRRHGRRMRIATKYRTLTTGFLAENNVQDYRLVRSAGATEAAPATGAADIIVDITSTGQTLAANHLKTIRNGTILASHATLFATGATSVSWSPAVLTMVKRILDMVDAKLNAASRKLILTRLPGVDTSDEAAGSEARAAEIQTLETELSGLVHSKVEFFQGSLMGAGRPDATGLSVMLTVPARQTHDVVSVLRSHGGREIIVLDTDYVFDTGDSSFERLKTLLPASA